jgi:iron complex outermembrane receptor protein
VRASYSYTNAEFTAGTIEGPASTTDLDGNQLPGVPTHRLGATAQLRTDVVHAATTVQHVGEQYGDSENTATIDAYTTVDLRLSHPGLPVTAGTKVTPFLALNNAFDVRYSDVVVNAFGGRFYEPAAGRHWRFGATLQID